MTLVLHTSGLLQSSDESATHACSSRTTPDCSSSHAAGGQRNVTTLILSPHLAGLPKIMLSTLLSTSGLPAASLAARSLYLTYCA